MCDRAYELLMLRHSIMQQHLLWSLSLSWNNYTLLFQHLCERPILMHRHQDITATDELLIDVQLRYGRPLGVFFDTCSYPLAYSVP
jgi:hypothetical protein